jgi:hypothetical protein
VPHGIGGELLRATERRGQRVERRALALGVLAADQDDVAVGVGVIATLRTRL